MPSVDSTGWTTVTLPQSYTSMVVIASANYESTDTPGIVRIQNASGHNFDVRVDSADVASTISGVTVYYVIVEDGV